MTRPPSEREQTRQAGQDKGVEAWAAVLKVHAAIVPELDRRLQATHGLPLTWYDVLLELNAAPERKLTIGELGERAVVSRTRVTRVVDELCRQGLVVRQANAEDRRSSFAALTPEGRRRLKEAAPTYLAGIEEVFGRHLRPEDADAVSRALGRVLHRIDGGGVTASLGRGSFRPRGPDGGVAQR